MKIEKVETDEAEYSKCLDTFIREVCCIKAS